VTIHLLSGALPTKNGKSESQPGDGDGQGAKGQRIADRDVATLLARLLRERR
jgi:hypothetical protein